MNNFAAMSATAMIAAFTLIGVASLLPIILPVVGAFVGFIVGGFFPGTSRAFLDAIGMQELAMWQFGAMLAFVGSFFKSSLIQQNGK